MSLPCRVGPMRRTLRFRLIFGVLFPASVAFFSGCKLREKSAVWNSGECRYGERLQVASVAPCVRTTVCRPVEGDTAAAELTTRAAVLEAACDPACVDLYFAATCRQWRHVESLGEYPTHDDLLHESRTYQACLAKLLVTAQRFGRFDTLGLRVFVRDQPVVVPISLHGFAWTAEDFNALELVGENRLGKHAQAVRTEGVGVPLVVLRKRPEEEEFHRHIQPFAATAVLRTRRSTDAPIVAAEGLETIDEELVLEFYNPAHCTHLAGMNQRWALAGDLTAPFAWGVSTTKNDPVTQFLRPDGADARAQLVMLEPYQRGKIPIVFVHGLLSDPLTWVTLGNALRAQPWFRERYQVWAFRYPSGVPFLVSAAALRRELNAAIAISPGAADDPTARQMVLVGHSMGGLVSKLQVTESGTDLWDLVANRPLDEIQADPADREQLREVFFFKPLPFVRKVVFIGTPHRGSSLASRGIGRVSSWAAKSTSTADERHRRVVAANPGVFVPWITRKVPTSVDLLEPGHPLLVAMEHMSVDPCVELHSIIGVDDVKPCAGPGDRVVSLKSASLPRVVSEKLVAETHEGLHEAATTQMEIERILERQLRDLDGARVSP